MPSSPAVTFSFAPPRPAAELLAEIRERGGRVYRMRHEQLVFCLTDDPELARWLARLGAKPYAAHGDNRPDTEPPGGFHRARLSHGGKVEFDVWIHTIKVADGESLWEAVGE